MKDFCLWIRSPDGQIYGTTGMEILRHGTRRKVHLPDNLEIEILIIESTPEPWLTRLATVLLSAYRFARGIR